MNVALIFAGGAGARMNSKSKPKQFLELHGKPIIIYTLEVFDRHPDIDKIAIVCIESHIDELKKCIVRFDLKKVSLIVTGGKSGFDSIFNGLDALKNECDQDDIVLIHDGVRPLIDEQLISDNIKCAREYGNAVTAVPVTEGIIISKDGKIADDFPDRKLMYATKAPQSYNYFMIYDLYKKAYKEGFTSIESAHLCKHYGIELHIVKGSYNNIKITTPTDYYVFRALYEIIENNQVIGY